MEVSGTAATRVLEASSSCSIFNLPPTFFPTPRILWVSHTLMGVKVLLETENQHLHEFDQQKDAWGASESPGADLDPDNNTVHQHQQRTWLLKPSLNVETSHWTSSSLASEHLHSSSRPPEDLQGFPNGMQYLKRALDHWATIQFRLPSAQVRHLSPCLWLTAGLWQL